MECCLVMSRLDLCHWTKRLPDTISWGLARCPNDGSVHACELVNRLPKQRPIHFDEFLHLQATTYFHSRSSSQLHVHVCLPNNNSHKQSLRKMHDKYLKACIIPVTYAREINASPICGMMRVIPFIVVTFIQALTFTKRFIDFHKRFSHIFRLSFSYDRFINYYLNYTFIPGLETCSYEIL